MISSTLTTYQILVTAAPLPFGLTVALFIAVAAVTRTERRR